METLPTPHPALEFIVTIPARDEEAAIASALRALRAQVDFTGRPLPPELFEIILLANNCSDHTARIAREISKIPHPRLHVLEHHPETGAMNVGAARKILMDLAASRLESLGKSDALIATTDADTRVAPDWIAATRSALKPGISAVAGHVAVDFSNLKSSDPAIAKYQRDYETYEHLRCALAAKLEPVPHEPRARHSIHTGASFALRAAIYRTVGGVPLLDSGEDIALYRNILAAGGLVRHSPDVRVHTSGREKGRVPRGLAHSLTGWAACAKSGSPYIVECPQEIARYHTVRAEIRQIYKPHSAVETARLIESLGLTANQSLNLLRDDPPLELLMDDLENARRQAPPKSPVSFAEAQPEFEALILSHSGKCRSGKSPHAVRQDASAPPPPTRTHAPGPPSAGR